MSESQENSPQPEGLQDSDGRSAPGGSGDAKKPANEETSTTAAGDASTRFAPSPGGPQDGGSDEVDAHGTQPMKTERASTFGGFDLDEKVGEGGMGVVYRAYDPDLQRTVAIKKIHPRLAGSDEYCQRFISEARAVAAVHHPNVAQIFSIHAREMETPPYFVMEFVEGRSLEDRIAEEGPLAVEEAIEIILKAARGLRAAHEQGIIHRDIKPSNILVGSSGEVKLVDFGLARQVSDLGSLTEVGVILGTPHYVSPEQGRGRPADHRSDIYSLGCTLYFLLTGKELFHGKSKMELIVAHANEPPPRLKDSRPGVPRTIGDILERMLSKTPEGRYQSYDDLVAELGSAHRELLGGAPPRTRVGVPVLVAILLPAILFVAYVAYAIQQSVENTDEKRVLARFGEYFTPGDPWDQLKFDFAAEGAKLGKFFKSTGLPLEGSHPPYVTQALIWQNDPRPIEFLYLDEFSFLELDKIRFAGQPDFELVLGHDPDHPENELRISWRVGVRNNGLESLVSCRRSGHPQPLETDARTIDFIPQDGVDYKISLSCKEDTVGDTVTFNFVIKNVAGDQPELASVHFRVAKQAVPTGQVALRGAGVAGTWTVSIERIFIQGRINYERTARALLP